MEEIRKELIEKIGQLYQRYGIKSVTMDDIAGELGISKKTLYKYFIDKADLVKKIVLHSIDEQKECFCQIADKKYNSIEILYEISKYVSKLLNNMNPSTTFDLKKYYPEAWKLLIEHKKNHIFNSIKLNIQKGINEGLYRADLKIDLIATIYVSRTEKVLNVEEYNGETKYSSSEIFEEMLKYHIRGIATPKGLKYYEDILFKEKNKKSKIN